jgi:hypothetical protein
MLTPDWWESARFLGLAPKFGSFSFPSLDSHPEHLRLMRTATFSTAYNIVRLKFFTKLLSLFVNPRYKNFKEAKNRKLIEWVVLT